MGAVSFHEVLEGWIGARELDVNMGVVTGRRDGTRLRLELDIDVPDVAAVAEDLAAPAQIRGVADSALLGGPCEVLPGSSFSVLAPRPEPRSSRMLYRLFVRDASGAPVTISGFKVVHDDRGWDVWTDTTSLHTRLLRGHLDRAVEDAAGPSEVLAAGIVEISLPTFLALVAGMRGSVADRLRFGRVFLGRLWEIYGGRAGAIQDSFADPTPDVDEEPPWFARLRARGVHGEVVPFRAGDGLPLKLTRFRGEAEPTRGPVLLVAGTGVRGAIFSSAPQPRTLVDALVGEGYDVWVEDWRASIDLPPLRYTLDQAAVFDHPAALREVKARTGAESLKAIVHCQGSTSFTMTALAGLAGDVRTVVSNAVSLHPTVTRLSRAKLSLLTPVASRVFDGADPQWAVRAPTPARRALAAWVHLRRHDCDEPACAMSTYIYGKGPDVLWRHANLDTATHHWVAREFGYVPFSFFRQILRSVKAGHLVPEDGLPELPRSFEDATPPPGQLWTFVAGERNVCFTPEGQRRSHAWFRERGPQDHGYAEFPGYSHLDVFFGRHAARDTFPAILDALGREPVPSG
jgi:predicted alpha/beta hydrolase